MSADSTAQVVAKMLESDDFVRRVASDASALDEFELDENEKSMLQAASADGIEHICRPSDGGELSEAELKNVAGGAGIRRLSAYLNRGFIPPSTRTALSKAVFSKYGTRPGETQGTFIL